MAERPTQQPPHYPSQTERSQQQSSSPNKRRRSYGPASAASSPPKSKPPTPSTETPTHSTPRPGYKPPGRLGEPRMELHQEPRLDARLAEVLSQYGLDRNRAPPSLATLSPTSTMAELGSSMAEAETGFEKLYESLPNALQSDTLELEVEHRTITIEGLDRNYITLYICRPVLRGGALPCVLHAHGGGGMTFLRADNKVHRRWCTSLAAMGMVVINIGYRNAWTPAKFNPFPAGLNDVCAAVQYVYAHRDELNIQNIVLQGDGGGGNLVLAAALKAKREGWTYKIDGVYASSPQISNAYNWSEQRKLQDLPSLIECHGYVLNVDYMAYMAHVYTPSSADATNSLAWPYHVTQEDLEGLPPHVISVDELDPLRSEGEAYARKLAQAGVQAVGHINLGAVHDAATIFRKAVPAMHRQAVRNVAVFAKQV